MKNRTANRRVLHVKPVCSQPTHVSCIHTRTQIYARACTNATHTCTRTQRISRMVRDCCSYYSFSYLLYFEFYRLPYSSCYHSYSNYSNYDFF